MDISRLSDSAKVDLCRKYFYIGLVFLPFVWLTNIVCFFRDAFCKPATDSRVKLRTYVILSAIGCLFWLFILTSWEIVYQHFRAQGLAWSDQLAFTFPLGKV